MNLLIYRFLSVILLDWISNGSFVPAIHFLFGFFYIKYKYEARWDIFVLGTKALFTSVNSTYLEIVSNQLEWIEITLYRLICFQSTAYTSEMIFVLNILYISVALLAILVIFGNQPISYFVVYFFGFPLAFIFVYNLQYMAFCSLLLLDVKSKSVGIDINMLGIWVRMLLTYKSIFVK